MRDVDNGYVTAHDMNSANDDPMHHLLGHSITYRIAVGPQQGRKASTQRLSLTHNGQVRYELKTPYANGTTHILFEPLDFMFRTNGMPRAQEAQELLLPSWSP